MTDDLLLALASWSPGVAFLVIGMERWLPKLCEHLAKWRPEIHVHMYVNEKDERDTD